MDLLLFFVVGIFEGVDDQELLSTILSQYLTQIFSPGPECICEMYGRLLYDPFTLLYGIQDVSED